MVGPWCPSAPVSPPSPPPVFSLAFARFSPSAHDTFESFTERYVQFFQTVESLFEVQRSLK